ncbi:MAG TPA: ACP S-malonyltransferase [Thermoleophilaceae bacterium]|nr:ACP S-malonyltransferase [Thermoleophilaceae bacterium]
MLFPGQGSQTADMRDQVERHRPDLLELAQSEVSDDLFERAEDGTRWAQPAIFCAALAGYEVLKDRHEPDLMAGHSLGEITALVAAGAIGAEDGLRLVAARGRLMQEAAEETGDGGMLAVRARDRAPVEEVGAAAGVSIANDNAPDQLVLSGALAALDEAERLLRERNVRAKRLPVAGAFHSPLMAPAVEPFRELAERVEVRDPRVPVLSCVTAAPFQDVRGQLVQAIVSPVRWTDVMSALHDLGATRYVETGPGRVLTNLVRKSLDDVEAEAPLAMEAAGA